MSRVIRQPKAPTSSTRLPGAASPIASDIQTRADRWIYLPAALAIGIIVVMGFGPSYFYRPFTTPAESLTLLVHVHGALMTAWIALFITQVSLVAFHRTDLHRLLGLIGMGLLILIVVVSFPMTVIAAKLGGDHMPGPAVPALALVLSLLITFSTFAALGFYYRPRSDFHKRLMLLAAVTAMEAGLIRLPLPFLDSLIKVHGANDALLLIVVVVDSVRHRRLHPVFLWGTAFLMAAQAFSFWLSGTAIWMRIAQGILGVFFE